MVNDNRNKMKLQALKLFQLKIDEKKTETKFPTKKVSEIQEGNHQSL